MSADGDQMRESEVDKIVQLRNRQHARRTLAKELLVAAVRNGGTNLSYAPLAAWSFDLAEAFLSENEVRNEAEGQELAGSMLERNEHEQRGRLQMRPLQG